MAASNPGFAREALASPRCRLLPPERYVTPGKPGGATFALSPSRWVLEVYRTIIETLQAVAWMLLVFFVVALIAFVIVRIFEFRRGDREKAAAPPSPDRRA